MAANPSLVSVSGSAAPLLPALFEGEFLALGRGGVEFQIDGLRTEDGKWSGHGAVYLTNMRLVVVQNVADPRSGLVSFELPLSYIHHSKFYQPIFACNNLQGALGCSGR